MSEFERHVNLTKGYDLRGQTPNCGQHPPHLVIWVKGEKAAMVLDINTGWYINDKAEEPRLWSRAVHQVVEDLYVDTDAVCDHCEFLGEPCFVCQDTSLDPEGKLMRAVKENGLDWCWQKLEDWYREIFEGGPEVSWEAPPAAAGVSPEGALR